MGGYMCNGQKIGVPKGRAPRKRGPNDAPLPIPLPESRCDCLHSSRSMGRGGRRPGTGVKKGDKRGPYNKGLKSVATKKNSLPSAASTEMLAAFVASGNNNQAPQDGHDGGAPAEAE